MKGTLRSIILSCLILVPFLVSAQAPDFAKWESAMINFEKEDKANPPMKKPIVFTGSSSIVGWKSLATDFPDKNILNRGFGGSQTFEVVHFADRIIKPYKPKQVIVYSGDNDIAAGKTPEEVLSDFKALFTKIREANKKAQVTYICIKPSPSRKKFTPQIVQANQLIKGFLAAQKRTDYVDIYTPMLMANGKPKPELFKPDSLHMLPAGYVIWAEVLKPYLK